MRNEVKLANPNYDSSKIEEFKNVWVFCEQRQGQMMSTSYELISEGRKLADELGVKLCGLLVGDNVEGLAESIGGYGAERVLRSPAAGVFEPKMEIGRMVKAGEVAALVGGQPMLCTIDGCLRGLLQGGLTVPAGMKCGDIDPRCKQSHCFQASNKALAVGGGVLEALLHFGCLPNK